MKRKTLTITAIVAAVALGLSLAAPAIAQGPGFGYGQGYGMGYGHHMMGPGQGRGHGYGMGPGQGMGYGRGMGGNPDCPWNQTSVDKQLTVEDVTKFFEGRLAIKGNPNVKLGEVTEKDGKTVTVTIVTKDGSLVKKIEVDRATGRHTMVR